MNFQELNIIEQLRKSLEKQGFRSATFIQKKIVPLILKRKSLWVQSQDEKGKTSAYLIPIIQLIQKIDGQKSDSAQTRVIILTSSNKISDKIKKYLVQLTEFTIAKFQLIFENNNIDELVKKPFHILVTSPEVLVSLIKNKKCDLSSVKMLVMDEIYLESDSFKENLDTIKPLLSNITQNLIFSQKPKSDDITWLNDLDIEMKEIVLKNPNLKGGNNKKHKSKQQNRNKKKKQPVDSNSSMGSRLPPSLSKKYMWPLE